MFILKLVLNLCLSAAFFAVLLFFPAQTLHWWRAWVLLALGFLGSTAALIGLARGNAGLVNERLKPPLQKGQPLADKIILFLYLVTILGLFLFIPLDVFRLHLMGKPGALVSSLGLVLAFAGWWLVYLALKENAFAAVVVKHQKERQQTVVDTGVYGIIRHPLYAGGALTAMSIPLWLESYAAALLSVVPIAIVALRIVFEERFLRRELTGYEAYTQRVHYRLIPFVW